MNVGEACFGKTPENEDLQPTHYAVLRKIYECPGHVAVKTSQAIPARLTEVPKSKARRHLKWSMCMMALVDLYSVGFVLMTTMDGDPDSWPRTYRLTAKGHDALERRSREILEVLFEDAAAEQAEVFGEAP